MLCIKAVRPNVENDGCMSDDYIAFCAYPFDIFGVLRHPKKKRIEISRPGLQKKSVDVDVEERPHAYALSG
jgi:hypothetical protein